MGVCMREGIKRYGWKQRVRAMLGVLTLSCRPPAAEKEQALQWESCAAAILGCCNFRMLLQYSCLSTRAPPAPAFHMLTPCRNLAGPGFPPLGGGNGRLELQSISGWNAPGKGIGPRGEVACDLCLLVPALTIPGGTVEFNECKVWGKTGGF